MPRQDEALDLNKHISAHTHAHKPDMFVLTRPRVLAAEAAATRIASLSP